MRLAITGARVILGLIFVVFGLNGFFNFIPVPAHNEAMGDFMGALMATGYMMPVVKATEVLAGLMILTGKKLPLGLTLLAPISINILLVHLFLDQGGLPMAIVIVALQLFLAWAYRDSFRGMLATNAAPA